MSLKVKLVKLTDRDIILLVEALRALQREMGIEDNPYHEAEGYAFSAKDIGQLVEHLNCGTHEEASV